MTRVYTPGAFLSPQPYPQDTIPASFQTPFFLQTKGPPLSPCDTENQIKTSSESNLLSFEKKVAILGLNYFVVNKLFQVIFLSTGFLFDNIPPLILDKLDLCTFSYINVK